MIRGLDVWWRTLKTFSVHNLLLRVASSATSLCSCPSHHASYIPTLVIWVKRNEYFLRPLCETFLTDISLLHTATANSPVAMKVAENIFFLPNLLQDACLQLLYQPPLSCLGSGGRRPTGTVKAEDIDLTAVWLVGVCCRGNKKHSGTPLRFWTVIFSQNKVSPFILHRFKKNFEKPSLKATFYRDCATQVFRGWCVEAWRSTTVTLTGDERWDNSLNQLARGGCRTSKISRLSLRLACKLVTAGSSVSGPVRTDAKNSGKSLQPPLCPAQQQQQKQQLWGAGTPVKDRRRCYVSASRKLFRRYYANFQPFGFSDFDTSYSSPNPTLRTREEKKRWLRHYLFV